MPNLRGIIAGLSLLVSLSGCASTEYSWLGLPFDASESERREYGARPNEKFPLAAVDVGRLDPRFRRQEVAYRGSEPKGTIIVDTPNRYLYLVTAEGRALRYGIEVGREGFGWSGVAMVGRTAVWPDWVPPKEMRLRQPELPERMPGGPNNPLGARTLYHYQGNKDTLYRIHGTAEPWTIGTNVSSGCIRLLNEEIADLYLRTPVNTRVIVL